MVLKLSEQVRRLEDSIESLRIENKMLKEDTVDIRDEVIDHQNQEIAKLKKELWARVEQVENLHDTLKKITKENLELQDENKRLKSKLEQTVDEYDEEYQTFHNNCKCNGKCRRRDEDKFYNDNFRRMFRDFLDDDF